MVRGLDLDLTNVLVVGKARRKGTVISIVGYGEEGKLESWRKMLGIQFIPVEIDEVGGC